jgi:RimJ/RimL family protein N-acetyltransferase
MDNWLSADGFRLAALGGEHVEAMWPWLQDGHFLRQLDAAAALPRAREQVALPWTRSQPDAVKLGVFRDEGPLVGLVGLDAILWNQRVASLVLAVGPPHQGQGAGRAALSRAIRLAFAELNLRRLQLTVFADNTRAVHLYEQAGFRREGVFREFLERDRIHTDMLLYGLLRREWGDSL